MDKRNELRCTIILITHSNYLDICENYLELKAKYWSDCKYQTILSYYGEKNNLKDFESKYHINTIYNETSIITDCIVNVLKTTESDYYICMLGDAFITDFVNQEDVDDLINQIYHNKINYCSLIYWKEKIRNRSTTLFRKIRLCDLYRHTFVSFIATKDYINDEIEGISDYDFEIKYLKQASDKRTEYIDNAVITKDIFHIRPGITKGNWDKRVLRKMEKQNPEISFSKRKCLPIFSQFKIEIRDAIFLKLSIKQRRVLKKILIKMGVGFATNY